MNEPGIARILVASLHQGISDLLPARLEFYENWLNPDGLGHSWWEEVPYWFRGYAALAYRLAYLKTHYPAEFLAARLAVWGGYYSPRVYMSEARQLGLSVKPPHINHSGESFTLDPIDRRTLWMGLDQVRDLTRTTIKMIITERPFESWLAGALFSWSW